jgi:hypothetical protein
MTVAVFVLGLLCFVVLAVIVLGCERLTGG